MSASRDRIHRILFISLGIASIIYTLLGAPQARGQLQHLHHFSGPALYVVCALLPPMAGLAALFSRLSVPRTLTAFYCVFYLLSMASWVPMMSPPAQPPTHVPWTQDVSAIAAAAAAVTWRPRTSCGYLAVLAVGTVLLHHAVVSDNWLIALQDGVFVLMLASIFVLLAHTSLDMGSELDMAAAQANSEAAREAATRSTHEQRLRLDALVHDHVLSLLLAAGRSTDDDRTVLRTAARQAIQALRFPRIDAAITGEELIARIRARAPNAFDVIAHTSAHVTLPSTAATALLEASEEAMRNSMRHAGTATRKVRVVATPRTVRIEITDDGSGFHLHRVRPERLGIRVSITARMHSVAGGRASVHSRLGQGTRVTLKWEGAL